MLRFRNMPTPSRGDGTPCSLVTFGVAKPQAVASMVIGSKSVVSGYKSNSFSWLGSEDSGNG